MGSVDIATGFSKISEASTVATRPPEGPAEIVKDVQTIEANFRYSSPNYHGTSKKVPGDLLRIFRDHSKSPYSQLNESLGLSFTHIWVGARLR